MSFYDKFPNFYGNNAESSAIPARTDAMRQARRDFRQLRNQGVVGQDSTMDARLGQLNATGVMDRQDMTDPQKAKWWEVRQNTRAGNAVNYAPGNNGQPSYTGDKGLDLQSFKDAMQNRFQNPNSPGLMPNAPEWMQAGRANRIMENISGRYNNGLPNNANPYQQTMDRKNKGQPS